MMRKQKEKKKAMKVEKSQAKSLLGSTAPVSSHIVVQLNLEQLYQFSHRPNNSGSSTCIIVFEPQFDNQKRTIERYLTNSAYKAEYKDLKEGNEKRILEIGMNLGDIAEDLIIPTSSVFPTSQMVSEVIQIDNMSTKHLETWTKIWMRSRCSKIIASIFMIEGTDEDSLKRMKTLRNHLVERPLGQSTNALSFIHSFKQEKLKAKEERSSESKLFEGVSLAQQIIDLENAMSYTKKNAEGQFTKNQDRSLVSQNVEMTRFYDEYSDNLMNEHQGVAASQFAVKMQTSEFVDCPSGDLNLIVKCLTQHGVQNLKQNADKSFVQLELLSSVPRDQILLKSIEKQEDVNNSQMISQYSIREDTDETKILMNHVSNHIARHINDRVAIKLIKGDEIVCQTEFELSGLKMVNGKTQSMVLMVAGS